MLIQHLVVINCDWAKDELAQLETLGTFLKAFVFLEGLTRYWRDSFEKKVARLACCMVETFGFGLRMEW